VLNPDMDPNGDFISMAKNLKISVGKEFYKNITHFFFPDPLK
jgi:hypothetical protein